MLLRHHREDLTGGLAQSKIQNQLPASLPPINEVPLHMGQDIPQVPRVRTIVQLDEIPRYTIVNQGEPRSGRGVPARAENLDSDRG